MLFPCKRLRLGSEIPFIPLGNRYQDLSGCHFLYIYGKDITDHDFSGTVLYCKEESVSGSLKILFIR